MAQNAKSKQTKAQTVKSSPPLAVDTAEEESGQEQAQDSTVQMRKVQLNNDGLDAGQSGDSQGLSRQAEAASESVEELADTGQAWESDAIAGVEDAADHPEHSVHVHTDYRRLSNLASETE